MRRVVREPPCLQCCLQLHKYFFFYLISGASVYNVAEEEEEEQIPSQEQCQENDVTMNKMKLLRAKMESLSITKKVSTG